VEGGLTRELKLRKAATDERVGIFTPDKTKRGTPRTVRCAAFFVGCENSDAFVGGGFPQFELPGQPTLHTRWPARRRCARRPGASRPRGLAAERPSHFEN